MPIAAQLPLTAIRPGFPTAALMAGAGQYGWVAFCVFLAQKMGRKCSFNPRVRVQWQFLWQITLCKVHTFLFLLSIVLLFILRLSLSLLLNVVSPSVTLYFPFSLKVRKSFLGFLTVGRCCHNFHNFRHKSSAFVALPLLPTTFSGTLNLLSVFHFFTPFCRVRFIS